MRREEIEEMKLLRRQLTAEWITPGVISKEQTMIDVGRAVDQTRQALARVIEIGLADLGEKSL